MNTSHAGGRTRHLFGVFALALGSGVCFGALAAADALPAKLQASSTDAAADARTAAEAAKTAARSARAAAEAAATAATQGMVAASAMTSSDPARVAAANAARAAARKAAKSAGADAAKAADTAAAAKTAAEAAAKSASTEDAKVAAGAAAKEAAEASSQAAEAAVSANAASDVAASDQDASAAKTLLSIFDRSSGKDAQDWQTYLLDDAAASVSAASIVGIDASVLTIAESTRDIGMLIKAKDSKGKGVGFSVTPARVSNPFPRVDFAEYAAAPRRWQPIVNLTLSFAQGTTSTDGKDYARRAVALSTGGTFMEEDDPILHRAAAFKCADDVIGDAYKKLAPATMSGPIVEQPSPGAPESVKVPAVQAELKKCLDKLTAQNDQRWFRPIWSLTLATGDVKLDKAGERTTTLGNSLALAARYGAPVMHKTHVRQTDRADGAGKDDRVFDWGWAVAASLKFTRGDPVLSTLGTATVERRSARLLALRASAGTDSLRILFEGSRLNANAKDTKDQSLKQALGVDIRMTKGAWLNFRYGKRKSVGSADDESASLLTLTVSTGALDWAKL